MKSSLEFLVQDLRSKYLPPANEVWGQGNAFTPVCLFVGGYLHPGVEHPRGLHPEELFIQMGLVPRGVCIQRGSAFREICIQGGLHPGAGGRHPGGLHSGGLGRSPHSLHPWGLGRPPSRDTAGYSQRAGGTHPTGMPKRQFGLTDVYH